MKYKHILNYSLKNISSIKIGGVCPHYFIVYDLEALEKIISMCKSQNLAYFIIGKASKILFDDGVCPFVIIQMAIKEFVISEDILTLGAGEYLPEVSQNLINLGYSNFTGISDIPGTIGGAIYQNAGANDSCISDTILYVDVLLDGEVKRYFKKDLTFAYRYSSFKLLNAVILKASFRLVKSTKKVERQKQIEYSKRRSLTQPLSYPSLGSTFINQDQKSIAFLIDELGLKGLRVGGAMISQLHGNFIINYANASAKNVRLLIDIILNKLYNTHRIIPRIEMIIPRW